MSTALAKRGPGRPRKTEIAQAVTQINAKYDAAGMGRRMRSWTPPSSGPNRAVVGIEKIRNRSRDARRNDWAGASSNQKWTTNLVGIGITPRFKRIKSKERKLFVTDLWNDFVAQSDADGVLNLYGQQTLAVASWLESGEVFIRRRPRSVDGVLAVPMQIQLVESDFVPMLDADTWPGMTPRHRIRSGIELSPSGQRVAYWMYREHPGDRSMSSGSSVSMDSLIRVPAADVRHMFQPPRPGALRGVSDLAPVLARLRNIADFDDAVLERQKLANLFMAFIKYTLPNLTGEENDPLTGKPIGGSLDAPLAALMPGIVQELEPGQEMQFANPPEAGTTYSDYMRTQHLGTAAASGIPYEIFSGDIKEVSDRTLRVLINEFRRLAEQRQWQIVIPMMCQPVIEWFAQAAVLVGKITVAEVEDVRRCEHAPHGWQHIHPVQDPQGKKLEVEAGFRSRSSVIGERGDDPDTVDDERQADDQREQTMSLGAYSEAVKAANAPAVDPDEEEDEDDDKQKTPQPTALDTALINRANAEAELLTARTIAARRTPEAPVVSELELRRLALTESVVNLLGVSHGE